MDEGDWWKVQDTRAIPDFGEMDYRTVLRLLDKYLPVEALAGRVLTPSLWTSSTCLTPVCRRALGRRTWRPPEDPREKP